MLVVNILINRHTIFRNFMAVITSHRLIFFVNVRLQAYVNNKPLKGSLILQH